jgi:pantetheine-phosphate adenylyltransferase
MERNPMTAISQGRTAVYTGVFDPITFGHLDVIRRGSLLFDHLVVGVGINPGKTPFFTLEERVSLVRDLVVPFANVEVQPFHELTVVFARRVGARVLLRGLRTTGDMEYEFRMSLMNRTLDAEMETVFVMANEDYSFISSTLVRQIASFGGGLEKFVPEPVQKALLARIQESHASIGSRESPHSPD